MDLDRYKSPSQRARVFSEKWVQSNLSCPACIHSLTKAPNNTKVRDFVCPICSDAFELKSKRGSFGPIVADGAYQSMVDIIRSGRAPHLVLLSYTSDYAVRDVIAIPNRFLIEEIVIPRPPLGEHCRRAGWQGCNLNVAMLPPDGKVAYVSNFEKRPAEDVRSEWNRTAFLDRLDSSSRGWLTLTMSLVRSIGKQEFCLRKR
ncbi:DpnI domain-containing protein [Rhodocyclus purpureus]|uniref:DpnI domain-containing protein n=1 Tax=Rhodocyclus purpureus TaxID=1067 RepID=UPI001913A568|nr:hypothetical protein [Rhodocyclus purpureus]